MNAQHTRTVSKEEYPQLLSSERRHMGVLQRRLRYLREKLSSGEHSEGAKSFIAAELSALDWALKKVETDELA